MHYDIYVKPTDGPLTVHERGDDGRFAWATADAAVAVARAKKRAHPHMDFIVCSVDERRKRTLVLDTSTEV